MSSPEPRVWKTTFHLQTSTIGCLLPMALGTRGIPSFSRLVHALGRKRNVCCLLRKVLESAFNTCPDAFGFDRKLRPSAREFQPQPVLVGTQRGHHNSPCGLGSASGTSCKTMPIMCSLGRRFRRAVGSPFFLHPCRRVQRSSDFLALVYPLSALQEMALRPPRRTTDLRPRPGPKSASTQRR